MKTHLPKTLSRALMAALLMSAISTAHGITLKKDVGLATNGNIGLSGTGKSDNDWVVSNGEAIGATVNGNLVTDFSSTTTNNLVIGKGGKYGDLSIADYQNLTIQNGGIVAVGGTSKDGKNHAGVYADEVTVEKGGQLLATKTFFNKLTVKGTASLHGHHTGGSGDLGYVKNVWGTDVLYEAPKMAQITSTVSVDGGHLTIGTTQATLNDEYYLAGFGSRWGTAATISQTSGTMDVYGSTLARSGLQITQESGSMRFRDRINLDGSSTDTKIVQTEKTQSDAKLIIGKLTSTDKQTVSLEQKGAGVLMLSYGASLGEGSTVEVNQSGSGTVELGKAHGMDIGSNEEYVNAYKAKFNKFDTTGTSFVIEQSGSGTINVQNVTNGAFSINQSNADAKLNLLKGASITSTKEAQISGTLTVAEGATLTTSALSLNDGSKTNIGGKVVVGAATDAAADGQILVNGGTLKLNNTEVEAALIATTGSICIEGAVTFTGQVMLGTTSLMKAADAATPAAADPLTLTITQGATIILDDSTFTVGEDTFVLAENTIINVKLLDDVVTQDEQLFTIDYRKSETTAALQAMLDQVELKFTKTDGSVVAASGLGVESLTLGKNVNRNIPEPTTATLALFALVGVAARRRRK